MSTEALAYEVDEQHLCCASQVWSMTLSSHLLEVLCTVLGLWIMHVLLVNAAPTAVHALRCTATGR